MNFLRNGHNLARILLGNFAFALGILCLSPATLFAETEIQPIVLPAVELITPVLLAHGVVSEVVVPETETNIAVSQSSAKIESSDLKRRPGHCLAQPIGSTATALDSLFANDCRSVSERAVSSLSQKNEPGAKTSDLKSVANLGLLAFFEICLSQSELPSKNLSTPCANSPSKSMIRKSANDSRSLWPLAKTISLWHRSISCLLIPRTSILEASPSRLHNMSDISSIWLSETDEYPLIWVEMMAVTPPTLLGKLETTKS